MTDQTKTEPQIEIKPHEEACNALLAAAITSANGNGFERLTFLNRCDSKIQEEARVLTRHLLDTHCGNIQSVTWDLDYEYDDEGGTYPSISNVTLQLGDDREIPLGDNSFFFGDEIDVEDFLAQEYPEASALASRLEEEGVDVHDAFTDAIAEMTGIPLEKINDFLGTLCDYINDNKRDESIEFTSAAPEVANA